MKDATLCAYDQGLDPDSSCVCTICHDLHYFKEILAFPFQFLSYQTQHEHLTYQQHNYLNSQRDEQAPQQSHSVHCTAVRRGRQAHDRGMVPIRCAKWPWLVRL